MDFNLVFGLVVRVVFVVLVRVILRRAKQGEFVLERFVQGIGDPRHVFAMGQDVRAAHGDLMRDNGLGDLAQALLFFGQEVHVPEHLTVRHIFLQADQNIDQRGFVFFGRVPVFSGDIYRNTERGFLHRNAFKMGMRVKRLAECATQCGQVVNYKWVPAHGANTVAFALQFVTRQIRRQDRVWAEGFVDDKRDELLVACREKVEVLRNRREVILALRRAPTASKYIA